MIKKTALETQTTIRNFLKCEEIALLYKKSFVNRRGTTAGIPRYYTEIIAEEVLEWLRHNRLKDKIVTVGREEYVVPGRDRRKKEKTNRQEEHSAKELYSYCRGGEYEISGLGNIIDYQIPLKKTSKDEGVGKIDLVAYGRKDNAVYLIEYKFHKNYSDTLLRAVLEIATYYQQLSLENILKSYSKELHGATENDIRKAVLLDEGCRAYKEAKELSSKRPKLSELIKKLKVAIFLMPKNSAIQYCAIRMLH